MELLIGILLFTITIVYFFGVEYIFEDLQKKEAKFSLIFIVALVIFCLGALGLALFWCEFLFIILKV